MSKEKKISKRESFNKIPHGQGHMSDEDFNEQQNILSKQKFDHTLKFPNHANLTKEQVVNRINKEEEKEKAKKNFKENEAKKYFQKLKSKY